MRQLKGLLGGLMAAACLVAGPALAAPCPNALSVYDTRGISTPLSAFSYNGSLAYCNIWEALDGTGTPQPSTMNIDGGINFHQTNPITGFAQDTSVQAASALAHSDAATGSTATNSVATAVATAAATAHADATSGSGRAGVTTAVTAAGAQAHTDAQAQASGTTGVASAVSAAAGQAHGDAGTIQSNQTTAATQAHTDAGTGATAVAGVTAAVASAAAQAHADATAGSGTSGITSAISSSGAQAHADAATVQGNQTTAASQAHTDAGAGTTATGGVTTAVTSASTQAHSDATIAATAASTTASQAHTDAGTNTSAISSGSAQAHSDAGTTTSAINAAAAQAHTDATSGSGAATTSAVNSASTQAHTDAGTNTSAISSASTQAHTDAGTVSTAVGSVTSAVNAGASQGHTDLQQVHTDLTNAATIPVACAQTGSATGAAGPCQSQTLDTKLQNQTLSLTTVGGAAIIPAGASQGTADFTITGLNGTGGVLTYQVEAADGVTWNQGTTIPTTTGVTYQTINADGSYQVELTAHLATRFSVTTAASSGSATWHYNSSTSTSGMKLRNPIPTPNITLLSAVSAAATGATMQVPTGGYYLIDLPSTLASGNAITIKTNDSNGALKTAATYTSAGADQTNFICLANQVQATLTGTPISASSIIAEYLGSCPPTVAATVQSPALTSNGAPINLVTTATTAVSTQLVAAVTGKAIYVTSVYLNSNLPTTLQFVYGTGTNCATGQTNLGGPFLFTGTSGGGSNLGSGAGNVMPPTPVSQALCILNTPGSATSTTVGGGVTDVQQ